MTQEHVVLHDWAVDHPETGNRILVQVTWTPMTGWSYALWDRDDWLSGEVELFDWTVIMERTAGLREWTRRDKQALRDMPERWRQIHDPHSPTSRRLAALS